MSVFIHKPSLWSRFFWSLAEILGLLPRGYLASLTDLALLEKAEMLIRLGDQPKAQRALDAASRRAIEDPRLLGQLANLQLRNGNKDVARRAHLRAAQSYLQRGMVDEATHVLQQILAVARDCLEARLALGQIAEGRYGHEEAVAHYLEAVKVLTARQEWEGVQELLERVRQLQRVKSVLESETQMMPPLLGPGPMPEPTSEDPTSRTGHEAYVSGDDGSMTLIDMATPVQRPRAIPEQVTDRSRPSMDELRIAESETIADRPSPLRLSAPSPRAPSTVIVEPDLTFPDTTDPVDLGAPPPPVSPAIPSTFVRTASMAAPSPATVAQGPTSAPAAKSAAAAKSAPAAKSATAADAAQDAARSSREAQLKAPTDIVFRENLPADLMIKIDTAVDFDPRRLMANAPSAEIQVPPEAIVMVPRDPEAANVVVADLVESTPVVRARDPTAGSRERRASVWDRAIVQGPRDAITLNVGPEPDPLVEGEPSILRRASTGISSVLNGFISGMSKDGGGSKS